MNHNQKEIYNLHQTVKRLRTRSVVVPTEAEIRDRAKSIRDPEAFVTGAMWAVHQVLTKNAIQDD